MGEERLIMEEELELHKQRLISEMEKFIEAVRQREEQINSFQKELNDNRWFLGEERARNMQLENNLRCFEQRCQELETQISHLKSECERLQKELADTQWYLGEERAGRQELENRIKNS